jgi:excinuclease ABC subunit C
MKRMSEIGPTNLRDKIKEFPKGPGCYLMKDAAGSVLYVGKARSLRDRIGSYFADSADLTPDKVRMVAQVTAIDYLEAASEVDALLTEARLIKDLHPPFNVRLLDDKTFPYLEITLGDDFPGVYFSREPAAKSKLYGPFTSAKELRAALPILQKIFKFRTCDLEIAAGDRKLRYQRPCLLHYIARCYAPCAGMIGKDEYRADIRRLERFLDGKRQPLLRSMHQQMLVLSGEKRYEEAAHLRDQIRAIESLAERGELDVHVQPEVFHRDPAAGLAALAKLLGRPGIRVIEGVDIANLSGRETVGSLVQFIDGKPFKAGYRRFRIKTVAGQDDFACIAEVVSRRFRRLKDEQQALPDLLLVDGGAGQLGAALGALKEIGATGVTVLSLAKRAEEIYLPDRAAPLALPRTSPALKMLQFVRDEAHRFAQHYHHILRRKSLLGERQEKGPGNAGKP